MRDRSKINESINNLDSNKLDQSFDKGSITRFQVKKSSVSTSGKKQNAEIQDNFAQ